jgi:hypothetical protein
VEIQDEEVSRATYAPRGAIASSQRPSDNSINYQAVAVSIESIADQIMVIRGQRVMLDVNPAALCGIP